MNKKNIITILGIILIIILIIISFNIGEKKESTKTSTEEDILANAQKESIEAKNKKQKDFTYINVDDYLNLYNSENNTLVLVARPTCAYCNTAEPIIKQIAYENDLNIHYLNTDEFEDGDYNRLKETDEIFENFGTPMLLVVSNSKINDYLDGLTDKKHYISFFKDNNFIN